MTDIIKKLQMFAAGDVVNYAGGSTPSNAGSYNVNANSAVSTGDLSAEMKTFYDKALIELAEPNLVHDQFGKKKPIPRNGGKTIEFRKFDNLPKALTPITEGVTPTGNKLKVSSLTATVDQFGDYIEQTDMLELTAIDNTIVEATKELASQAGRTLDTIVREVLNGGTAVMYARKNNGGGSFSAVESRADITAACPLTVKDVFRAATELKNVNAPKINGAYIAILHPIVAYSLMQEAGDAWTDIQKYKNPEAIYRGEIGMLGGVRFVESTEAKIYAPAVLTDGQTRLSVYENASSTATSLKVTGELTAASGVSIPCYINGVANTITAITPATGSGYSTLTITALSANVSAGAVVCGKGGGKDGSAVFSTIFLAEGAYGTTEITGGGLEHIVKQRGYGNDPLNQRSSIGWKATKTATRLIEEYILRVESGSPDFSGITNSN